MCVTLPGRVLEVDGAGARAVVEIGGTRRPVSLTVLALQGEEVAVGEWLLVSTGLAIERIDETEARGYLDLLERKPRR